MKPVTIIKATTFALRELNCLATSRGSCTFNMVCQQCKYKTNTTLKKWLVHTNERYIIKWIEEQKKKTVRLHVLSNHIHQRRSFSHWLNLNLKAASGWLTEVILELIFIHHTRHSFLFLFQEHCQYLFQVPK